jgi:hypothetical protein
MHIIMLAACASGHLKGKEQNYNVMCVACFNKFRHQHKSTIGSPHAYTSREMNRPLLIVISSIFISLVATPQDHVEHIQMYDYGLGKQVNKKLPKPAIN